MKIWEALKALEEGKKIRCIDWEEGEYYFRSGVNILNEKLNILVDMSAENINGVWELYEEKPEIKPDPYVGKKTIMKKSNSQSIITIDCSLYRTGRANYDSIEHLKEFWYIEGEDF
jgi:hypothetical protein